MSCRGFTVRRDVTFPEYGACRHAHIRATRSTQAYIVAPSTHGANSAPPKSKLSLLVGWPEAVLSIRSNIRSPHCCTVSSPRAVVKNLIILLPNEECSACNPSGELRETHLRWVLDPLDRDRYAEIAIFPFTVLASDMKNAPPARPLKICSQVRNTVRSKLPSVRRRARHGRSFFEHRGKFAAASTESPTITIVVM